jgi:hypothetical protein
VTTEGVSSTSGIAAASAAAAAVDVAGGGHMGQQSTVLSLLTDPGLIMLPRVFCIY